MFLGLNEKNSTSTAIIDDSKASVTYGELCTFSQTFSSFVKKRTLAFILCDNEIGAIAGFIASLSNAVVPLLLSSKIDKVLLDQLIEKYHPTYFWQSSDTEFDFKSEPIFSAYGYELLTTGLTPYSLHEDLSMLLSTSGSTGSPKLVRHSYKNVERNAENVARFFELSTEDRPIAALPIHYTMGLSVVVSHLYAGATILLTKRGLLDPAFWQFLKEQKATSFTGVPYNFELLHKLRFFRMDLPSLTLLTQGGGKLSEQLFKDFADFADRTGKKFIATYGQTEGTARMAYLPAHLATQKTGSIGYAIPEGRLYVVNDKGEELLDREQVGEMVYEGPNVTMGYATEGVDLSKGDENHGVLYTGDIVKRDEDDAYYIIGRKNRFLKLYGLRISLDEIEQMIKSNFKVDCACSGDDQKMIVRITEEDIIKEVSKYIADKTQLYHQAFEVVYEETILRNEAGKIMY
ncbi:AMP-binding protein [Lewinella sp. LCG006]|uniref:AMP-binding protein n=1 Tax=Lewinella sp. LCG006 TaxID=3231911 RepID=UPI00346004B1